MARKKDLSVLVKTVTMLLQFELCGQDTSASSFAFRLDQALNFSKLVLKDVRLVCGNDLLHETWAYTVHGVGASSRTLTAPLYLTLDALTDNHVAHYLPATFPANDSRNCVVSNNIYFGRTRVKHVTK